MSRVLDKVKSYGLELISDTLGVCFGLPNVEKRFRNFQNSDFIKTSDLKRDVQKQMEELDRLTTQQASGVWKIEIEKYKYILERLEH